MSELDNILKVGTIYEKLMDLKSKEIFNIRFDYLINRDMDILRSKLLNVNDTYESKEFEAFMDKLKGDYPICIWGSGRTGINTYNILRKSQVSCKVEAFCDTNTTLWGSQIEGIKIIAPYELWRNKDKYAVVIASEGFVSEIYENLLFHSYPRERIFYPSKRYFVAFTGNQYFDLKGMEHSDNEVFIDAGSYDLSTSLEFIKWCEGKYSKIYAFEPCEESIQICKEIIKFNNIQNIELLEAGTWSETNKRVSFNIDGSGSSIKEYGNAQIDVMRIDDAVKDQAVTFIKMDVEGSELKSLEGAKETILRCKPKLAISVYHKPEDIMEIPLYLLDLVPEYKLYIRHYASNQWETVLYAIP